MAKRKRTVKPLPTIWHVPDELWDIIKPILAKYDRPQRTGRPRIDARGALGRDHLPDAERLSVESTSQRVSRRQFGASHVPAVDQTPSAGPYLESLGPRRRGTGWRRLAMAVGRHGLGQSSDGGDQIGPNPTDRAKNGVKRRVWVEAAGGPLAPLVAPANRNDQFLLEQTIEAIVVDRPEPTKQAPQHLCLDKGYDTPTGHQVAEDYHYTPPIRRIRPGAVGRRGTKEVSRPAPR